MELHPLCTLFPRMSSSEFTTLRDDIAANGLLTPITTYEGMILDGGNRYRACIEAGVEPRYEEYAGDDLVQFVLSSNLNRRHLMPGQIAVIVSKAQDWTKANIQGRNRVTGHVAGDTIEDRAALSGASERTQRRADKLARESPELAMKVAQGELSLPEALKQLPEKPMPTTQQRVKCKPKSGPKADALREELRLADERNYSTIEAQVNTLLLLLAEPLHLSEHEVMLMEQLAAQFATRIAQLTGEQK